MGTHQNCLMRVNPMIDHNKCFHGEFRNVSMLLFRKTSNQSCQMYVYRYHLNGQPGAQCPLLPARKKVGIMIMRLGKL